MEYNETINTAQVAPVATSEGMGAVEAFSLQTIERPISPEILAPVEHEPLEAKIMRDVREGTPVSEVMKHVADGFPESTDGNPNDEDSQDSRFSQEVTLFERKSPDVTTDGDTVSVENEIDQSRVNLHPAVKEDPMFKQKLGEVIQEQQAEGEIDYDAAEQEAYRRYMEEQEQVNNDEVSETDSEQDIQNLEVEDEIMRTEQILKALEKSIEADDRLVESADRLSESIEGLIQVHEGIDDTLNQLKEQLQLLLKLYTSEKAKKGGDDLYVQMLRVVIRKVKLLLARFGDDDGDEEMAA